MEVNSLSNIYLRQLGEQRPCISGLCPSIFSNNGLERNSIVEITGNDGSGKTFLLMHLMAHCLTQCDVILIDLSHKIDVQMLGKLVEHAVKEANPESSTENLQEIVGKCMDSLHIINCFSSDQVRMAIKALDHHILINNPKIGLIAVDGLSEFYWSDLQPNRPLSKYMYYMNLLEKWIQDVWLGVRRTYP